MSRAWMVWSLIWALVTKLAETAPPAPPSAIKPATAATKMAARLTEKCFMRRGLSRKRGGPEECAERYCGGRHNHQTQERDRAATHSDSSIVNCPPCGGAGHRLVTHTPSGLRSQ